MEADTQGYDQPTNMPLKLQYVGQGGEICVFPERRMRRDKRRIRGVGSSETEETWGKTLTPEGFNISD